MLCRRIVLLFTCAVLVCLQCLNENAGTSPITIQQPVWHIGDSWVVRYSSRDHLSRVRSGRTLYKVTGIQNVSRYKCYVLQRIPLGDFLPIPSQYEFYVYYRTTDMVLLREQTFERGEKGAPHSLCEQRDWLPEPPPYSSEQQVKILCSSDLLPPFPILAHSEKIIVRKTKHVEDAYGLWMSDTSRERQTQKKTGNKQYVTEWVAAQAERSATILHGNKSIPSLKVKFCWMNDTELEGKVRHSCDVVMEQTWVPGMPWWTSAESGLVTYALEIRPPWLTTVEAAGGMCCIVGLVALWRRRTRTSALPTSSPG